MDMGDISELVNSQSAITISADPGEPQLAEDDLPTDDTDILAEDECDEDGIQVLAEAQHLAFPSAQEFSNMTGQQLIIIPQPDGSNVAVHGNIADLMEPSAKRLCLNGAGGGQTFVQLKNEDGQTYMLAVQNGHVDLSGVTGEDLSAVSKVDSGLEDGQTSGAEEDVSDAPEMSINVDLQDVSEAKGGKNMGTMDITQAWFTTKDDKNALQNKGFQWKQGQWSREEVDVLQQNIASYCKDRQIPDPTSIIFEMSKDDRKDFYRTIARGLQRPLFSVYRRVIRMYDQRNHVGKYSSSELDQLKVLRMKHGTDWASIGMALGRSASSVKDRCRLMKDTCNSGKWLPEEEKLLSAAVYELSGAQPGDSVTGGLSWAQVAERVGTRSEKQCRTKWLNYLNWKHRGGTEWTRDDDILLVERIMQSDVMEESQVDWPALSEGWSSPSVVVVLLCPHHDWGLALVDMDYHVDVDGGCILTGRAVGQTRSEMNARSPQWLRAKWWTLKRHVPEYHIHGFSGTLQALHTMFTQNIRHKALSTSKMTTFAHNINLSSVTMAVPLTLPNQDLDANFVPISESADTAGLQYNLAATPAQGALLIPEQIIVHTLPLAQLTGGENMQVNGQQQVLIAPLLQHGHQVGMRDLQLEAAHLAAGSMPQVVTLPIGVTETGEDVQLTDDNSVSDTIIEGSSGIIAVDVSQGLISHEVLADESSDGETGLGTPGLEPVDPNDDTSDLDPGVTSALAMVTASSSQLIETSSADHDLIHMSSLSDPMLTSDDADLMATTLDVETEKVSVVETETEPESPS